MKDEDAEIIAKMLEDDENEIMAQKMQQDMYSTKN
jgi:hypothetical protein